MKDEKTSTSSSEKGGFLSIRTSLVLILGGLAVCLFALGGILYTVTESYFDQSLGRELHGDLAWAASAIEKDPSLLRPPETDSLCKAISRFMGYRITVIDSTGRISGDSHTSLDSLPFLENQASRSEVIEARLKGEGSSRRYSHIFGMQTLYMARTTVSGNVIRVAASFSVLEQFRRFALKSVFWILLLFVGTVGVSFVWIQRRIHKPLLRLVEDARDISRPLRWEASLREAEVLNKSLSEYMGSIQKLVTNVREDNDRLSTVMNLLEEGIIILSPERRVIKANAVALKFLQPGSDPADWGGRLFDEIILHESLRAFTANTGEPGRQPFLQIEKGLENEFDLMCHIRGLGGSTGEYLLTVVNITDFRNLERAFHKVERVKNEFVTNLSHAVKAPLSSIRGYAETLLDGALEKPDTREQFVRKIRDNAFRMQKMLQDLLSLSQLETQLRPFNAAPVLVRTYVQAAAQLFNSDVHRKAIHFENQVPVDFSLRMESKDLELICNNLIGNAVRYNQEDGKIIVSWEMDTRHLVFKDTGIGMAAELLPKIFNHTDIANGTNGRKDGGGIGLAIVKQAAQRYGMSVKVESCLGVGTEFRVEVPEDILASS